MAEAMIGFTSLQRDAGEIVGADARGDRFLGEGRVVAAGEHDDRMRRGHRANVLQRVAIG